MSQSQLFNKISKSDSVLPKRIPKRKSVWTPQPTPNKKIKIKTIVSDEPDDHESSSRSEPSLDVESVSSHSLDIGSVSREEDIDVFSVSSESEPESISSDSDIISPNDLDSFRPEILEFSESKSINKAQRTG